MRLHGTGRAHSSLAAGGERTVGASSTAKHAVDISAAGSLARDVLADCEVCHRPNGVIGCGTLVAARAWMKAAFAFIALIHGVIHLLGFAKGLGLAHVPQLQLPISRAAGWAWLLACLALALSAALVYLSPRYWGVVMVVGLGMSQYLVFRHFQDAKFGTIANVILLLPALVNTLDLRPTSLRSEYEAAVRRITGAPPQPASVVTERDLLTLPEPVQRYLRRVGVVGRPRVHNARVRMAIQIRGSASESWMEGEVEQYNDFDAGLRFFFLQAKRGAVTFDVAHLFDERGATMRARVLGLLPVMDGSGEQLTRSETVTLLNDMSILAPATLLSSALEWSAVDSTRARVTLSHGSHRVSATLMFSADGDLINFVSTDRAQSDGKTSALYPWWTPMSDYHAFGEHRLASIGEAQWEEPGGLWTYARIKVQQVAYNVDR